MTFPIVQEQNSPIVLRNIIQIKFGSLIYSHLLPFLLYHLVFPGTSHELSLLLNYTPNRTIPLGHNLCRSFEITT